MSRHLPLSPRIEHLKKEAKSLLKAQKSGDKGCLTVLRNLHQWANATDESIFRHALSLSEAQLALAKEYGFDNWNALEQYVKNLAEFPDGHPNEEDLPVRPAIDWLPAGKPAWHAGWMNGYVRGIELILNREGIAVDYDTLMGDIGQAFIMQGEEGSRNLVRGQVDIGWWPLELLGFMRLNFIEKVTGKQIFDIIADGDAVGNDPVQVYRQIFAPAIQDSLQRGMPCVAVRIDDAEFILTGCDDSRHPLIGACTNARENEVQIGRIAAPVPPYALLTFGAGLNRIAREAADREALAFAIALHQDRLFDSDTDEFDLRHKELFRPTWRTGRKSFQAWISELQQVNYTGETYWHANVRSFLLNNRKAALRYLEKMRDRHPGQTAGCLAAAMQAYQEVIALASALPVTDESVKLPAGRVKMVEIIAAMADQEARAVQHLQSALDSLNTGCPPHHRSAAAARPC